MTNNKYRERPLPGRPIVRYTLGDRFIFQRYPDNSVTVEVFREDARLSHIEFDSHEWQKLVSELAKRVTPACDLP